MRRIATLFTLLLVGAGALAVTAGADDKKTYQAELFNGFGLVEGSEARIAGVKAGSVTDLDITAEKTALITFEVGPEFPELTNQATCSSEPQSLIAEYFIDCQPGNGDGPLEGPIPADRNQTTVQNDLVQNTLREPFKRRFQLILNEFGTALVGNAENLNAAIRSGAPALRELSQVLKILGRQNRLIAQLNVDSDVIFSRLVERQEDVVRFIDEAEDAGRISAERREDLATDFDLLDDFLFELRPVMHELGNLARQQTPLLTDLRAAAPGLNKLAANLPAFNRASEVSLESLGRAAEVGERAVTKARDEISQLNITAQKAQPGGDLIADFLESLDDPRYAIEEDCDARYDLRELPGEADRRVRILEQRIGEPLTGQRTNCGPFNSTNLGPGVGNPGYTGLEGLLNYGYVQTASLNVFDQIGHGLAIQLVGEGTVSEAHECGEYSSGGELAGTDNHHGGWPQDEDFTPGDPEVNTRDIEKAAHCVGALGDYQPGITPGTIEGDQAGEPDTGLTQFNPAPGSPSLPPYDPEVCSPPPPPQNSSVHVGAKGSTNVGICDPRGGLDADAAFEGATPQGAAQPQAQQPTEKEIDDVLEQITEGALEDIDEIRDQLGLPPGAPLPNEIDEALGGGTNGANGTTPAVPAPGVNGTSSSGSSPSSSAATGLLDYLFGP